MLTPVGTFTFSQNTNDFTPEAKNFISFARAHYVLFSVTDHFGGTSTSERTGFSKLLFAGFTPTTAVAPSVPYL